MLYTFVDNWPWFLGLFFLVFGLRQFRLYVLRKKKDRESKPPEPVTNTLVDTAYDAHQAAATPLPVEPPAPVPAPAKREVNEVEEFYREERRKFEARP